MNQILIDRFRLPKEAKEIFLERVKANRDFIKNLDGFLGDQIFIREETGEIHFITVATWKDKQSLENAKTLVFSEYQKQAFVMPEFLKTHSIQIEREIYEKVS
ncbi:antibiotic biosynthesis monooxygenase [Leptospira congkakensis]|uniref:Antibiotic biosynthesis monooxygenase n=1 Tax=Leptospira congkakensis TaxID=2484932 RepID=A0A4Z1AN65_9LEPT|nr:antibiotic biosynthesis monooxygenase [Leptospira congkakensis]TGL90973.1 antibiotic biosynthesis monooxygenase [Leptospira congkakensis]TGL91982.1 antibiotic biosynthesis monooxygenase [Leptospira congkakensis]TGL99031.1 antibiotic biosynthesis monooxygenase [Leptospira congkakensis]